MNENKWCVYCHTNKTNNKIYVGITSVGTKERWGIEGSGYKTQVFGRAIEKYGWDNFNHEIIHDNVNESFAKNEEMRLIEFYDSNNPKKGYNLTKGGDGSLGFFASDETRKKQSVSAKKRTDLKKEVICLETGEIFESTIECAKFLGVHPSNVINVCNGKHNKTCNLSFKYLEHYKEEDKKTLNNNILISDVLDEYKKIPVNSKPVVCLNNGKEYISATQAEKEAGCKKISECCNGNRKSTYDREGTKLFWLYKEKYLNATKEEIDSIINYKKKTTNKVLINTTTKEKFYNIDVASRREGISPPTFRKRMKLGETSYMYYEDYLKQQEVV